MTVADWSEQLVSRTGEGNPASMSFRTSDAATLRPHRLMLVVSLALVCCAALVPARPAAADQTVDNLLRRGFKDLAEAQKAYTAGKRELQRKLAERASDYFVQARKLEPRALNVWFFGTQAAAFAGDQRSAVDWYNGYRSRTPKGINDPDLHFLQAFVYVFAGDNPDRAVAALTRMKAIDARRRAVERDTIAYIARLRWGNALMNQNAHHAAAKQFTEAARLSRRRGWVAKELAALGNSGIALKLATEYPRAVEIFDALIQRDPDSALWHWHKGLALGSQHKFDEAVSAYRTVIELRAKGSRTADHEAELDSVHLRLGNCQRLVAGGLAPGSKRRAELLTQAEKELKQFVKLRPKDARGYRWLGELYANDKEQPYDAIKAYEKAYELDWACGDVPLRGLVQMYTRNPPPPGTEPEAERRAAWAKRLAELTKLRDDEAEKRTKELERRQRELGEREGVCD